MFEQSLARCFRCIMHLNDFPTMPLLIDELEIRQEEIMQKGPFITIQIIEEFDHLRTFEPRVPEVLPDLRPVLLLDVGVVVFVVWA